MEQPQIRFTKTSDGVSIAYYAIGHGPAIVIMPAMPATHIELEWKVDAMRERFERTASVGTFVRYDGRGFGLSSRNVTDFSVEAMVKDLEVVTDALALRPFALMAAFHMAMPALAYAARHPERVAAVVLWLGVGRGIDYLAGRGVSYRELARTDWEFYKDTLAQRVGFETTSEEAYRRLLDECFTQEQVLAFFDAVQSWGVTEILPNVSAPTLVLGRREVHYPSPEMGRELAAALPNAELVTLEGSSTAHTTADVAAAVAEFLVRTGTRGVRPPEAAAPAPGGLRTVLFTDIVGHTEMMQRLGDAKGREVLREHERITRETLKQYGGTEIKTDGDSFMMSFGSVTKAVDCAIALQRAFAAHTDSMPEPLHVRVGLNAGEPIEDEGDLFGSTVILASRIAARAGAGEILVPDTVRGLLSGKGFMFSDRGEFVPKGFDDTVRLYEVRWHD